MFFFFFLLKRTPILPVARSLHQLTTNLSGWPPHLLSRLGFLCLFGGPLLFLCLVQWSSTCSNLGCFKSYPLGSPVAGKSPLIISVLFLPYTDFTPITSFNLATLQRAARRFLMAGHGLRAVKSVYSTRACSQSWGENDRARAEILFDLNSLIY